MKTNLCEMNPVFTRNGIRILKRVGRDDRHHMKDGQLFMILKRGEDQVILSKPIDSLIFLSYQTGTAANHKFINDAKYQTFDDTYIDRDDILNINAADTY